MAKAIDVGTCFIVGAAREDGEEVFTVGRNAFFSMDADEFAEDMLERAGIYYIQKGHKIYVLGEDALKFSVITGDQENYHRPMARGVVNPDEKEAVEMIQMLIEDIVGEPSFPGELLAVTAPADPMDADFDVTFHRMLLKRFLRKMGYEVHFLTESVSIVYGENPSTLDENGEKIDYTGIGVSFGAGMVNMGLVYRGKDMVALSCCRSGDWIDEEVARATGTPVPKVIAYKENKLNLAEVDMTNRLAVALDIYYDELIEYVLVNFAKELEKQGVNLPHPVGIYIAGGTSKPPGFKEKFEEVLNRMDFPLQINEVKHCDDPLTAVASGALTVAEIEEEKRGKKSGTVSSEPDRV